ncbi:MAG: hypothetical protein KGI06_05860 [Candidatus Micrarchaeota archaeon]|nr:hypothetical protein [Candidatus Micrarchaeota archaeon]
MTNYAVEVTTNVTEIAPFSRDRTTISIFNNGNVTCYVSQDQQNIIDDGYPLEPGASITFKGSPNTSPQDPIYGQCTSLSTDLRVKEVYQGEDVTVTSAPPTVAGSQNEFQQLSAASEAGQLIIVQGSLGALGIIVSYTPAAGIHFDEFIAVIDSNSTTNPIQAKLRNATQIRETGNTFTNVNEYRFVTKGDSLLGDGLKTYDIDVTVWTSDTLYATLQGVIH